MDLPTAELADEAQGFPRANRQEHTVDRLHRRLGAFEQPGQYAATAEGTV